MRGTSFIFNCSLIAVAILVSGSRSGLKSATIQLLNLALKKPALALGITPAYINEDFPSPDAPVSIKNFFASSCLTICSICSSLPLKKIDSSSLNGRKPG